MSTPAINQGLPLFIYGTLLPGQPNAGLLQGSVVHAEPAAIPVGRLYDMGAFPMLLEGGGGAIAGLLVEVRDAVYHQVLARLDRLEGCDPENLGDNVFRRLARQVVLNSQQRRTAWVYLGTEARVSGRPLITSGSWVAHAATKTSQIQLWWETFSGLYPDG